MKDKIYLVIIGIILTVGIVKHISLKHINNKLIQNQEKVSQSLKREYQRKKDSLIATYLNEIEMFEFENNSLNEYNNTLTLKIKKYEKKLHYNDRTFDTAADIVSNATYDNRP